MKYYQNVSNTFNRIGVYIYSPYLSNKIMRTYKNASPQTRFVQNYSEKKCGSGVDWGAKSSIRRFLLSALKCKYLSFKIFDIVFS